MSKAAVNNEIVLMRKDAEQAQVHIIKKLSRNAKKLRDKKGTVTQKAQNLRKADRIAAEILAIKKVKNDEIIHFALTNVLSLEEILQDQTSNPLTRIKSRIASHKNFSKKIAEFKEKYPNFLKLIEPGRKKRAKLEKKEKEKLKNLEKSKKLDNTYKKIEETIEKESSDKFNESENVKTENLLNDFADSTNKIEHINKNFHMNVVKNDDREKSTIKVEDESVKLSNKSHSLESKKLKKKKVVDVTKAVSKVATVKKFADILKEDKAKLSENLLELEIESKIFNTDVEKEVDPFFVSENGSSNFLSVALRKRKVDSEENTKIDFIQFNPDKGPHNKLSKNNNLMFNSNKSNPKWKKQSNDRSRFDNKKSDYIERNRIQRNGKEGKKFVNKLHDDSKQRQTPREDRRVIENEDGKNLHPSWEAKKKLQDILKQGFQGKKIVFGDD